MIERELYNRVSMLVIFVVLVVVAMPAWTAGDPVAISLPEMGMSDFDGGMGLGTLTSDPLFTFHKRSHSAQKCYL